MTLPNRYEDLLGAMPRGSFYDAAGSVLPWRGASPYLLYVAPLPASRSFNIFVNGVAAGGVTSDAGGAASVSVVLSQGRNDILLVDTVTTAQFPVYVVARVSAVVQAAHADAFATIDTNNDDIRAAFSIATVNTRLIEDVYGSRVSQPMPADWTLGSYRDLLETLRQAYRVYGSKVAGLDGVVVGVCAALPLIVPRAWRPTWELAGELGAPFAFSKLLEVSSPPPSPPGLFLPNLNARSATYVHAAFGGAGTTFPPPFTSPPTPRALAVVFSALWNGGDVIVSGVDVLGNTVTETFTTIGMQPLTAGETVIGDVDFATVVAATKGPGSGGTASIGVSFGQFVTVDGFGPMTTAGSHTFLYSTSPDRLSFDSGPAVDVGAVDLPASGQATFTLASSDSVAAWYGLATVGPSGSGNFVCDDLGFARWLTLAVDGRGALQIELPSGTPTLAQVCTAINSALNADPRYGASYASTAVQAVTGVNNFCSVVFMSSQATGTRGSIEILPGGADAARAVLGLPRWSCFLAGTAQYGDVGLVVPGGARLYDAGPVVMVLGGAGVLATQGSVSSGLVQPDAVGALEVYFSAAWNGGDVIVSGLGYGGGGPQGRLVGGRFPGSAVSETFVPPSTRAVASGTSATADGTGTLVTLSGSQADLVAVGQFFRFTSGGATGAGGYVIQVPGSGVALLSASVGAASTGAWTLTADAVMVGTVGFASVALVTNDSVVGSVPVGTPVGYANVAVSGGAVGTSDGGYWARLGRSMRLNGTGASGGMMTPIGSGETATFTLPAGDNTFPVDVGGSLLISGSGSGNDGLHRVIDLYQRTGLVVAFEPTGGTFSLESGVTWRLYSAGERVRVAGTNLGTGSVVLYPPGVTCGGGWPIGALVETEELPFVTLGIEGDQTATISVDRTFVPSVGGFDTVTLDGSIVPDGFRARNQVPSADALGPGYMDPVRLFLSGSGVADADNASVGNGDQTLDWTCPPDLVAGVRGTYVRAGFWVQQGVQAAAISLRVDFSFDGLNFNAGASVGGGLGNPALVTGTYVESSLMSGTLDPVLAAGRVLVPVDAAVLVVRLRQLATGTPGPVQAITVERVDVVGETAGRGVGGVFLREGTLAGDAQQVNFGEVLWVWSAEPLTAEEGTDLGVPAPPDGVPPVVNDVVSVGHVDRIANAHGYWSRFDVSEYLSLADGGEALNLVGCYTDLDWMTATLTNMSMVVGTPPRTTTVVPTSTSVVSQTLSFFSPSNATVTVPSLHEGDLFGPVGPAGGVVPMASISDPSGGAQTLTDLGAGFVGATGLSIVVSGARIPTNNGTFTITGVVGGGTGVTYTNAAGAAEPSFVGTYRVYELFPERPALGFAGAGSVLTAGGVVVPASGYAGVNGSLPWRWLSPTLVQVASSSAGDGAAAFYPTTSTGGGDPIYAPALTYAVSYPQMTRAETPGIDLGARFSGGGTWQDYLWLVDAALYRRTEVTARTLSLTQQLSFLANYQATLRVVSNQDPTVATLVADNGIVATTVAAANWSYVDNLTVQLNPAVFDPTVVYSFSYTGLVPDYPDVAEVRIEHRSSTVGVGDLATQLYRVVQPGDLVASATGPQYHQLRATFAGVVDVRDVSLSGLGLRGVHLFGSGAFAPGVVLP